MDRRTTVYRYTEPGTGVRTIKSTDLESLERLSAALFAELAGEQSSAQVMGFQVAGGGGGASMEATYAIANALGPGNSVLCSRAIVRFAVAHEGPDLDRTVGRIVAAMLAAEPSSELVEVQRAGTGRDGTYLIGLLFDRYGDGAPTEFAAYPGTSNPTDQIVDVLSLAVPDQPPDTPGAWTPYLFLWSVSLQKSPGPPGDITAQLFLDRPSAPNLTRQAYQIGPPNGEWWPAGGQWVEFSPSTGSGYSIAIRLSVANGNYSYRQAHLTRLRIGRSGEPG